MTKSSRTHCAQWSEGSLAEVELTGLLPGDHHFYITFRTRMPGVSRSPSISPERFPDEMTIVIQHRYWDLKVAPDCFTVGLSVRRRSRDASSCRSRR